METLLYFRLRRCPEPWNAHLPKGDEPYHKRRKHWLRNCGAENCNFGHQLPKPRNRKRRYYNARRAARRANGRGIGRGIGLFF
jgi:hypothetical protein